MSSSGREHWLRVELGHSGAEILPAIVKIGAAREIAAEADYMEILGEKVCPRIYGRWSIDGHRGGMAIQWVHHHPVLRSPLMVKARNLLEKLVWTRSATAHHVEDWMDSFRERFNWMPPEWIVDEEPCLIHGDPTLANIIETSGIIVLIDPKPPGRGIPSFKSVDRGKMLQSLLGWELLLSGGDKGDIDLIETQLWPFADLDTQDLLRAVWWCIVHLRRIRAREVIASDIDRWALDRIEQLESFVETHAGSV